MRRGNLRPRLPKGRLVIRKQKRLAEQGTRDSEPCPSPNLHCVQGPPTHPGDVRRPLATCTLQPGIKTPYVHHVSRPGGHSSEIIPQPRIGTGNSSVSTILTNDHPFFKQEARLGPAAYATGPFYAACTSNQCVEINDSNLPCLKPSSRGPLVWRP